MARVYPRTRAHTYTYTIIKRQCLSVVWGSIPILWWELSSARLYENISIVFNLKGLRPIHVRVIIYAGLSHHFFVKPFMVVYKHWSLKMQIETSYLYFKIIYILPFDFWGSKVLNRILTFLTWTWECHYFQCAAPSETHSVCDFIW